jgi:hypothetical protein
MSVFYDNAGSQGPDPCAQLSHVAQDLLRALQERGASFFVDLVRMANHLPAEVEDGLWELVAAGLVTADGLWTRADASQKDERGLAVRDTRLGDGRCSEMLSAISDQPSVPSVWLRSPHPLPLTPHVQSSLSRANSFVATVSSSVICWPVSH